MNARVKHARPVAVYARLARDSHEFLTLQALARQVAAVKGCDFHEPHDPHDPAASPTYLIPHESLLAEEARQLGVSSEHDLLGGVVPFAFMKTKCITHSLWSDQALAPAGWSGQFGRAVADCVLPGYSTFDVEAARLAGRHLLKAGSVRIKLGSGIGGSGQVVVSNARALSEALDAIAPEEFDEAGVLVESNLKDVVTLSVGQARLDDLLVAYCGTQQLTVNRHGEQVYGGSSLLLVRGGLDVLMECGLDERMRIAVDQARRYHAAAQRCYPGFYASRANYDVAQGHDDRGQWRSGVLEQSWRVGGASAAELLAMAEFRRNPQARLLRAATVERYGATCEIPPSAVVHYQGVDARVGSLTKYALLEQ